MSAEPLAIYLNDHLAGSVGALQLIDTLIEHSRGAPLEAKLRSLRGEIEEDQATLRRILDRIDADENRLKQAAAWVSEKVSHAKLTLATRAHPGLALVEVSRPWASAYGASWASGWCCRTWRPAIPGSRASTTRGSRRGPRSSMRSSSASKSKRRGPPSRPRRWAPARCLAKPDSDRTAVARVDLARERGPIRASAAGGELPWNVRREIGALRVQGAR